MYAYNTPAHAHTQHISLTFKRIGQSSASSPSLVAVCIHGNRCQQKQRAEQRSTPRPHHIHRTTEEQPTAKSHDSTIWVSAAGAILMGKKEATEGSADITGPHGFLASSHGRILPSVAVFATRPNVFHWDSKHNSRQIHEVLTSTPRRELSAARKQPCLHQASPPQQKTASVSPPPLSAAAWFTALSLYFCLSLMLNHISTSLLSLSLSLSNSQLCLSALLSLCPEDVEHVFRVGVGNCWLHRWHAYFPHW